MYRQFAMIRNGVIDGNIIRNGELCANKLIYFLLMKHKIQQNGCGDTLRPSKCIRTQKDRLYLYSKNIGQYASTMLIAFSFLADNVALKVMSSVFFSNENRF